MTNEPRLPSFLSTERVSLHRIDRYLGPSLLDVRLYFSLIVASLCLQFSRKSRRNTES